MSDNKYFFPLFLLIFLSLSFTIKGCGTFHQQQTLPYYKSYLWQDEWWNFYTRALYYADIGLLDKALSDLDMAINQNHVDQEQALMYDYFYIDYFPKRERGIILYKKGHIDEAIEELETSLSQIETAKAKYYLDEARRKRIEDKQFDKYPPSINIEMPQSSSFINDFSVVVRGIAKDDTFVKSIRVGEKNVKIDISKPTIEFQADIPIVSGKNVIPIRVTDLIGKENETSITVNADRTLPILRIDSPREGDYLVDGSVISLRGYSFDNSGLSELSVNGKKIENLSGQKELFIEKKILFESDKNEIIVEVKDRAENVNSIRISLNKKKVDLFAQNTIVSTNNKVLSDGLYYNSDRKNVAAQIHSKNENQQTGQCYFELTHLKESQQDEEIPVSLFVDAGPKTYLEKIYIKGNIINYNKVQQLLIDGESVLFREQQGGPNTNYIIHEIRLVEGETFTEIKIIPFSGFAKTLNIPVIKRYALYEPLIIAVDIVREHKGDDRKLTWGIKDSLSSVIDEHPRFDVRELESSNRDTVVSVAKKKKFECVNYMENQEEFVCKNFKNQGNQICKKFDCILLVEVLEGQEGVSVTMRLVNLYTNKNILLNRNEKNKKNHYYKKYNKGEQLKEAICNELFEIFLERLPMEEGPVKEGDDNEGIVVVELIENLPKGIEILLTRKVEKEGYIGFCPEKIAQARLDSLRESIYYNATINCQYHTVPIGPEHFAMIR